MAEESIPPDLPTRPCPFCGDTIFTFTKKCNHCGKSLETPQGQSAAPPSRYITYKHHDKLLPFWQSPMVLCGVIGMALLLLIFILVMGI